METGAFAHSEELYQQAVILGEAQKQDTLISAAYRGMGELCGTRKEWTRAMEFLHKARQIDIRLDHRLGLVKDYMTLIWWMPSPRNLKEAEQLFRRILACHSEDAVQEEMARSYSGLGHVYLNQKEAELAEEMFHKAYLLDEALGNKVYAAIQLTAKGLTHLSRNDPAQAEQLVRQAIAQHAETGDRKGLDYHYAALRDIYIGFDDQKALSIGQELCALLEEFDVRVEWPSAYVGVAQVLKNLRHLNQAEEFLLKALEVSEALGLAQHAIEVHVRLADLYVDVGHIDWAEEEYNAVLNLCKRQQDKMGEAQAYVELGNLRTHSNDTAGTRAFWSRAQLLFWQVGRPDLVERVNASFEQLEKR
jgi:tetratricopeptide (TPR) repeat protein